MVDEERFLPSSSTISILLLFFLPDLFFLPYLIPFIFYCLYLLSPTISSLFLLLSTLLPFIFPSFCDLPLLFPSFILLFLVSLSLCSLPYWFSSQPSSFFPHFNTLLFFLFSSLLAIFPLLFTFLSHPSTLLPFSISLSFLPPLPSVLIPHMISPFVMYSSGQCVSRNQS